MDEMSDVEFVFQPPLAQVSQLMLNVWRRPCWEYTPELLCSYLDKPDEDSSLSLGCYLGKEIIGYLAYLPQVIQYHDEQFRMLYGTWWTANHQYAGCGIGMKLQRKLLQAARERNYQGILTITHFGTHADKANQRTFSFLKESFNCINTFTQMITTPRMARRRLSSVTPLDVCPYSPLLRLKCLSILNSPANHVDLARVVQESEMDYILYSRPISHTWVYLRENSVKALISIAEKKYLGETDANNAYIEYFVFEGLTKNECLRFWRGVLEDPFWNTIDTICIPDIKYMPSELLAEMGFCKTIKKFNLYHIPLDKHLNIKPVGSFYLPVF